MMNSIGGPLFILRWKGTICPCLESSSDASARRALTELTGLKVKWHRKGVTRTISSWFGSKDTSSKDAVDSVLGWVDTEKGPELQIQPQQGGTGVEGEISLKQSAGYMKTVLLSKIEKVNVQEKVIMLQSSKGEDLVSIEVVSKEPSLVKEWFIHMIEWDGRRQAAIPEEDREIEDPGMNRAQKAAHFAKREIELQQTKRDREKRKAKLVKETGGLKYTAIAMANRTDDA